MPPSIFRCFARGVEILAEIDNLRANGVAPRVVTTLGSVAIDYGDSSPNTVLDDQTATLRALGWRWNGNAWIFAVVE